jgi:aminopeptidase N
MDRQLKQWQSGVERLWSATAPDYRDAARLLAEIARAADDPALRQAAAQALPSLRDASLDSAGRGSKALARRRLSVVRDVLHALAAPQFGKRRSPVRLTPEEHHRQLLGLPLGRRLAAAEIHQAYKRAAKSAHPDGGGNAHEFQQLSAARDALMKQR